ncbi:BadF/BadG/BcrA/BcrD ATPase family protein [Microbacterium sp.]|uniref:N-acetylglucosamine kinase n=1 Tax=Microbacterium sp. TaxID=51671 RepID=UPI003341378C
MTSQPVSEGLLIGVDAGGTSTRATLLDRSGRCIGYGASGSGNPTSAGPERAAQSVVDAVSRAVAAGGRRLDEVRGITAAMAGHGARGEGGWLADALAGAGIDGALGFESDLLALYYSGASEPEGYAIVSGTGAAVIRVAEGDIDATADGLGWLLGDRGSGFWIGHHVALAAVEELDGRGPATSLTPAVLAAFDIAPGKPLGYGRQVELEALIREIYLHRPVELSRLAPLAFAATDDAVSRRILVEAGELLAKTFTAVHRGTGPLVVGGSVLAQPGVLSDTFSRRIAERDADVQLRLVGDGVVGAAYLALRHAGVVLDAAGHAILSASVAAARAR